MTKKISQREAMALRKRVRELEQQRCLLISRWSIPTGAIHIASVGFLGIDYAKIETAGKLGCVVLAKSLNSNQIEFYAVKP